jgi:hypothetical protein
MKLSILFLLMLSELAVAQVNFEFKFGRRRDNKPRVEMNFGLGHSRKDIWSRRRNAVRNHITLESGEQLVGYTLISDGGFDYDNVEVINKDNIDSVKLKVIGDNVRIDRLSVRFCDGNFEVEDFDVYQTLPRNSSTQWLDLRGRNRCITSFSVIGKGDHDGYEATVVLVGRDLPERRHHRNHQETYEYMESVPQSVQPLLPACEFAGAGTFNVHNYKFRIKVGEQLVTAADTIDDAVTAVQKLQAQQVCSPQPQPCQLMGAGTFSVHTYNHRLGINGLPVMASDNFDIILKWLGKMREAGICQ